MRVKVTSTGKPHGTHVVNAETGEEIEQILDVKILIGPDNGFIPIVKIELFADIEIVGEADENG